MVSSIFTQIINRQLPATIRYEDEEVIAINDIHPQARTHVLVIWKEEIASLEQMHSDQIGRFYGKAMKIAQQLGFSATGKGYRLSVHVGKPYQEIDHVHLHLMSDAVLS